MHYVRPSGEPAGNG